jgi:hypothetical protein
LGEIDIYNSIRAEIVTNHALMHWYSIIVAVVLLSGILIVENRNSILSLFLPLLTVAWAAAMVRFDFFIHRQAAYLRTVEEKLPSQGITIPMWETWKASLQSSKYIIPAADVLALMVIVLPTIYLLFGPAQKYFSHRQWGGGRLYAWAVTGITILLLLFLAVVPSIAKL